MLHTITLFSVLFLTWVIWSGYLTPFFLITGLIAVSLSVYIAKRMDVVEPPNNRRPIYFNYKIFPYHLWLIKEIILSSWNTTKLIWQIKPNISPTLACINATQDNDTALTLFANSITLTPGTVSVMVEKKRILVHALQEASIDDLMEGNMDRNVSHAANLPKIKKGRA